MSDESLIHDYRYIFQKDVLRGKVAFITGGGTGIGFTIAEILMRHGCDTVIASRRLDVVKNSAEKLSKGTGQKCLPLQVDVRKPETITKAVDEALGQFKHIDILVNNAAGNFLCPAENLSFNAFKTVMEIDAHGTFNVSKAVFDKYMKSNGGVIINITATLSFRGQHLQTHAGSAKAAIEAMTKHLAVEWGPNGVRMMCVAPGPIADTEGMRRLGGDKITDAFIKSIPVQRLGKREDIGNTVLYIVSPAAELLTGTTVIPDGGEFLTSQNNYWALKNNPVFKQLISKM
ncbi:peroxisomal 2,4-dienoyl-CoA reductase [(3E)-enoyl-CoA-producing]-like [Saccostrea echinata]|uniref:peroxisomal 2,4-dienoyl-CoA reductase [(3E)-enoyl-CoA-producing]-like n=1 Tax=Saccostrea echinata TaxID=191078 RepID=UPI002A7F7EE9|nr:peroxisomal 2,4-dienoyl-CoA reductase [(3E)-enoyl-CoA-producing]-like [Saccostrea echinata]